MKTFFALLAFCAENSPISGEFPAQRPVTRHFDVFFDLHLNKWFSKPSSRRWFETTSRPLWCHCNDASVMWHKDLPYFVVVHYSIPHLHVIHGHLSPRTVNVWWCVCSTKNEVVFIGVHVTSCSRKCRGFFRQTSIEEQTSHCVGDPYHHDVIPMKRLEWDILKLPKPRFFSECYQ